MIYTLGCSFTKWYWPTWSDWLKAYQGPVTNWAYPGYSNQLIYWILQDRIDQLTSNDHVYIMWSEVTRVPQWYDREWVTKNDCKGFFPNANGKLWFGHEDYTGLYRTHPTHQTSLSHMIIDTFRTILETQQLLDSIGVRYTMMFMCNPWQDVRPEYKPTFELQWPKKTGFSHKDAVLAKTLLQLNPLQNVLKRIKWDNFVEKPDLQDPESYTGMWEYYLHRKELVLLKHNTDPHPNILAHHDYLTEKILKQPPNLNKLRVSALKLAEESVNMVLPIWDTGDFIGSPDKELLNTQGKIWTIK